MHAGYSSRPYIPSFHSSSARGNGDRFIPNRGAMDMDVARYMLLTEQNKKEKDVNAVVSPSKEAYRKALRDILLEGRTRILYFGERPPLPTINYYLSDPSICTVPMRRNYYSSDPFCTVPVRKQRYIPEIPDKILDAPNLLDDSSLNLLDWGKSNVLTIGLGNTVYLRNGTNGSISELVTVDDECGPVTSVSWDPDGHHIAIGLNSSDVQIWDAASSKLVRMLSGIHSSRVGCLAWNHHVLTSGSMDSSIVNSDVRGRARCSRSFNAHTGEVCALKWSESGRYLASGGKDHLVYIWNLNCRTHFHRLAGHKSAVRALSWCPHESNTLASGAGRFLKFWNGNT